MYQCCHRISPLLPSLIVVWLTAWLLSSHPAPFWAQGGMLLLAGGTPLLFHLLQTWWIAHIHGHLYEYPVLSDRWRQACQQVEVDFCPIYVRLGRNAYTAKVVGTAPQRCYVYVPDVLLDVLSPVHLDCALVHLACHLKLGHLRKWTKFYLQWWAAWFMMAGAVFLMMVATGESLTGYGFSARGYAIWGSVAFGLHHFLWDGHARHLAREQEFDADTLAVELVDNRLTYVEALREQERFQPLDFVHYVKEPTADERRLALIKGDNP